MRDRSARVGSRAVLATLVSSMLVDSVVGRDLREAGRAEAPSVLRGRVVDSPTGTGATARHRMWLRAGQRVSVAAESERDIDLLLRRADDGVLVDGAVTLETTETLIVERSGAYEVEVSAPACCEGYTLQVYAAGDPGAPQPSRARVAQVFVVGEALVVYEGAPRGLPQRLMLPGVKRRDRGMPTGTARERLETLEAIKDVARNPDVRWVEPNYVMRALGPADASRPARDP